ncbi:MAG TPA: GDSL-type esterase/lipase family protein [Trichocoleus sp.]
MAVPLREKLQLTSLIQSLQRVPPWALLSLVMNGLLFITVLVMLRQMSTLSDTTASVIPQANAFAAEGKTEATLVPQFGERHSLDYQQWVSLLEQEATAIATRNAPRQTILLGDSLTLWFPSDLLPGRRTWVNQAISGENSEGLRQRLYILDKTNPEVVFIMIGINDLIWGKSEDQMVDNVREMVAYLQETHPDAKIVVQSILPHGSEQATWEGRERLLALPNKKIQTMNGKFKQIAEEAGVYYLDLYPLFANGEGSLRSDLSTDGLHLNWQGYMVWRTAIAFFNETELGQL